MDKRNRKRARYASAVIWAVCAAVVTCLNAQVSPRPLSKDNVMELLSGGVSPKRVATIVQERKINFELDTATEAQLRQVGATDALIEALRGVAPKPPQTALPDSRQVLPIPAAPPSSAPSAAPPGGSDVEAQQAFEGALAALRAKNYEEAVTLFGRAARLKPGWADPLVERAKLETKLGRFTDTIEDCSEALRLNSNDAVALYFRGFANYQLNRNDAAIADFNKALRLKPDYQEAYKNRGNARWAIGDKSGANSDFAMARSLQGGKR